MEAKKELSLDELDHVVGGSSVYVPREEHVQKDSWQCEKILMSFCPQCGSHISPVNPSICFKCDIQWIMDD